MMTHWTRSRVDTALLAEITRAAGGDPGLVAAAGEANTARHAYELWRAAGLDGACDALCGQVAENLTAFAEGRLEIAVLMVDFEDLSLVGASSGARALVSA
jgi:cobalt-precorrin-5B (C1)-methyltransferase